MPKLSKAAYEPRESAVRIALLILARLAMLETSTATKANVRSGLSVYEHVASFRPL